MIGLKEILTKSLQGYFVALAFLEKYFCKHLAILAFSDFRIFRTKWPPESETDTSSSIIKGKAEQGRSQELEMGGAKLLGEGSWGALGFKHLINKFPKKSKIKILFIHVVFFFKKVHMHLWHPWLRPCGNCFELPIWKMDPGYFYLRRKSLPTPFFPGGLDRHC